MDMKRCKTCGEEKSITDFYETSYVSKKTGTKTRMPHCKPCYQARSKAYHAHDPGAQSARVRAWTERQLAERPEEYKARRRDIQLRSMYGISAEDWDRLYDEQLGRCVICLVTFGESKPCVDHDHETGEVRGLLCPQCNVGIGNLGDSVENLQRAVAYLEAAPLPVDSPQTVMS